MSPVAGASPITAATSTPNSSGSVCAVTSYGRFGGPPGYSRRSGYCLTLEQRLRVGAERLAQEHDVAASGIRLPIRRDRRRGLADLHLPVLQRPDHALEGLRVGLRLRDDERRRPGIAAPRRHSCLTRDRPCPRSSRANPAGRAPPRRASPSSRRSGTSRCRRCPTSRPATARGSSTSSRARRSRARCRAGRTGGRWATPGARSPSR